MGIDKKFEVGQVTALSESISGEVIIPGGAAYEDLRRVHNGLIDKHPAFIVQCLSTADVVETLMFVKALNLPISVRGGGHNVAGRAVADGGGMIDLSCMKGMHVDAKNSTIRVQPGVTWGEFNRETQLYGLATTGGMISSTGVAGLTLGGGLGALMSKYGLTIDNLLSAEIVTIDGEVRTASESENSDLFWAIRGGGGNFGIVTSFKFRLHKVGPIIQGGLSVYAGHEISDLLKFYRNYMATIQDEMSLLTVIRFHPDESGSLCAALFVSHCGEQKNGEHEIAKIREFAEPMIDQLGPISYTKLNTLVDSSFPRLALNYWKSSYIRELTDEAIRILINQFRQCPSTMSRIIIDHFHGEAIRPDTDATAYPNRSEGYYILIISQWADESDNEQNILWAKNTYTALEPFMENGVYSNYMSDDEMDIRIQAAFGENYERLRAIKTKYDPQNILKLNQNIVPLDSDA